MGRVKIAMKRIESVTNRQVTLSKRKAGLFKKCMELSVLCDAEVAAIVFSDTKKLYHYPESPRGVRSTVERFISITNCPPQVGERKTNEEGIYCELGPYISGLKEKTRELEKEKKNLMGEDLDLLSLSELATYESILEESIKKVRNKKKQMRMQEVINNENQIQLLQVQNHELQKEIQYFDIYNHELQKRSEESESIINEVSTLINKDDVIYSKYKDIFSI